MYRNHTDADPILIVEDDPEIRASLKELLEMEGYGVLTAMHGADALALLRSATPSLIMLDLMMPVMDGREFLDRAGPQLAANAIPVVVLSATAEGSDAAGAVEVLRKPPDIDHLLEAVRRHLRQGFAADVGLRRESFAGDAVQPRRVGGR